MTRVLIANRGEVAMRIIRACRELGLSPVVIYSTADAGSPVVAAADEGFCVGPPPASASYLNVGAVLTAAQALGAELVHPGYGFLAENALFASACAEAGLTFVGPSADVISLMGDKIRAREFAIASDVPVLPAETMSELSAADGPAIVARLGLPLLIKAAAGGGGRGMREVGTAEELPARLAEAAGEAAAAFGDGTVYLERLVRDARHVEVQVFGTAPGAVVHLGERECSVQRRHQKVIEEAPGACLPPRTVERLRAAAVELAAHAGYLGAGTVEFLFDPATESFFFLEMNTRLQVEHPVTELVTGVDIVREQLLLALHGVSSLEQRDVRLRGHAIECRITAEDPLRDFRPSPGTLTRLRWPGGPGVRIDSYLTEGGSISPYYDSLIAKVVVHDSDRPRALARMRRALGETEIEGVATNLSLLSSIVTDATFHADRHSTTWLERSKLLHGHARRPEPTP